MLNINMATAESYIENYIINSGMDIGDWCISQAASDLIDYMDATGIDVYECVPSDEFTDILAEAAR